MNFISAPAPRQPTHFRLKKHDLVVIDDSHFRRLKSDAHGHLLCRVGDTEVTEFITHAVFQELLNADRLVVQVDWYRDGAAELRARHDSVSFTDLSPKDQAQVLLYKALCDRILTHDRTIGRVPRSDKGLTRYVLSVWPSILEEQAANNGHKLIFGDVAPIPPKPSATRNMLAKYKAAGYDAIALRNSRYRSGNRTPRLAPEVYAVAEKFIQAYASDAKPTKAMLYEEYKGALNCLNLGRRSQGQPLVPLLGRRSFEKAIDRLDPWKVTVAREGQAAAQGKFGVVLAGPQITRPGQRIEMDECTLDLHALLVTAGSWERMTPAERKKVERVRPYVTVAIDVATKCIMGAVVHVEAPCAETAIACIEMTTLDKTQFAILAGAETPWDMAGRGAGYASDTGSAQRANPTHAAVLDLKAEIIHPPVKKPHLRGSIERYFGTLLRDFIRYFSGQTFGNVVEKGEYQSEANASLTVEEVARLLVRWIVDVYHNTPHASLKGATPRNKWLELNALYPIMPPPGKEERRRIFGKRVSCSIQKRGIRVLGIDYQSLEIQKLRRKVGQEKLTVSIDRFDLSAVSVKTDDGWIRVPVGNPDIDLSGVTYWEWVAAAHALRRKNHDLAELSVAVVQRAIEAIRANSDSAVARAGLCSPIMSDAEFKHYEGSLFSTFNFTSTADGDVDGSIDEVAAFALEDMSAYADPDPIPEIPVAIATESPQLGNPAVAATSRFILED